MADQTLATLTSSMQALEDERTALLQRVEALDRAIDGLRTAVASLDGTSASATASPSRRGAAKAATSKGSNASKRAARKPPGPRVGADDLVAALRGAGGSATTAELVEALGVNDGRNLNGARRLAVDAGHVVVDDGTYRLVGDDAAEDGQPGSGNGAGEDDGAAEQTTLSDDEWEASGGAATGSDELGRRFP